MSRLALQAVSGVLVINEWGSLSGEGLLGLGLHLGRSERDLEDFHLVQEPTEGRALEMAPSGNVAVVADDQGRVC